MTGSLSEPAPLAAAFPFVPAVAQDPRGHAAVFADPGRRTARGRIFDPEAYEPPLTTVLGLAQAAPAACVKVAPGIPHDAVPYGAEAEWISDGGEVKEAALWLGRLSGARRGTTLAFIEVKWRERPEDLDLAIDQWRLRRVAAAAEMLIPRFARPSDEIRIDVMLLAPKRLPRHLVHVWQP